MNPEIEELRRQKAEAEKKAEQYRHQEQRLLNRIQYPEYPGSNPFKKV